MATAVTVRADFSTDELRRLAAASKHANQSRRLLSLAAVLDGMSRADAARIGGMDRQTLRDWVHRFNERAQGQLVERPPAAPLGGTAGSSPRSLKPARSAPCMESCAGAGWTCSRSWPSASASLTTSARSARSSSSSASRTSARVRAIRPRTRRPWRLLKKLRRDAEHSPRRPAEGQADRDLVPGRSPHRPEERPRAAVGAARLAPTPARRSALRSAYLFGAICPARGTGAALAMPYADSEAMQL